MVLCYPTTPKKWAMTVGFFIASVSLFGVGVHLSYANVAPQQARTQARAEMIRAKLRKKYGDKYKGL